MNFQRKNSDLNNNKSVVVTTSASPSSTSSTSSTSDNKKERSPNNNSTKADTDGNGDVTVINKHESLTKSTVAASLVFPTPTNVVTATSKPPPAHQQKHQQRPSPLLASISTASSTQAPPSSTATAAVPAAPFVGVEASVSPQGRSFFAWFKSLATPSPVSYKRRRSGESGNNSRNSSSNSRNSSSRYNSNSINSNSRYNTRRYLDDETLSDSIVNFDGTAAAAGAARVAGTAGSSAGMAGTARTAGAAGATAHSGFVDLKKLTSIRGFKESEENEKMSLDRVTTKTATSTEIEDNDVYVSDDVDHVSCGDLEGKHNIHDDDGYNCDDIYCIREDTTRGSSLINEYKWKFSKCLIAVSIVFLSILFILGISTILWLHTIPSLIQYSLDTASIDLLQASISEISGDSFKIAVKSKIKRSMNIPVTLKTFQASLLHYPTDKFKAEYQTMLDKRDDESQHDQSEAAAAAAAAVARELSSSQHKQQFAINFNSSNFNNFDFSSNNQIASNDSYTHHQLQFRRVSNESTKSFNNIIKRRLQAIHRYSPYIYKSSKFPSYLVVAKIVIPDQEIKGLLTDASYQSTFQIVDHQVFQILLKEITSVGHSQLVVSGNPGVHLLGHTFRNSIFEQVVTVHGPKLRVSYDEYLEHQRREEESIRDDENDDDDKALIGTASAAVVPAVSVVSLDMSGSDSDVARLHLKAQIDNRNGQMALNPVGVVMLQTKYKNQPIVEISSPGNTTLNPGKNSIDFFGEFVRLNQGTQDRMEALTELLSSMITGNSVVLETTGVSCSNALFNAAVENIHLYTPLTVLSKEEKKRMNGNIPLLQDIKIESIELIPNPQNFLEAGIKAKGFVLIGNPFGPNAPIEIPKALFKGLLLSPQAHIQQPQSQQTQTQKTQSQQAQSQQAQSQQAQPQQAQPRQIQSQEAHPQQVPPQQTQSREAQSKQAQTQQAPNQQAESEQAESEQAESEQAESEQAESEQAESEQAESEQAESEQTQGNTSNEKHNPVSSGDSILENDEQQQQQQLMMASFHGTLVEVRNTENQINNKTSNYGIETKEKMGIMKIYTQKIEFSANIILNLLNEGIEFQRFIKLFISENIVSLMLHNVKSTINISSPIGVFQLKDVLLNRDLKFIGLNGFKKISVSNFYIESFPFHQPNFAAAASANDQQSSKGLKIGIDVSLPNDSGVSLYLGTLYIDLLYQGSHLAYLSSPDCRLMKGINRLKFTGRVLLREIDLQTLLAFGRQYISGSGPVVEARLIKSVPAHSEGEDNGEGLYANPYGGSSSGNGGEDANSADNTDNADDGAATAAVKLPDWLREALTNTKLQVKLPGMTENHSGTTGSSRGPVAGFAANLLHFLGLRNRGEEAPNTTSSNAIPLQQQEQQIRSSKTDSGPDSVENSGREEENSQYLNGFTFETSSSNRLSPAEPFQRDSPLHRGTTIFSDLFSNVLNGISQLARHSGRTSSRSR